MKDISKGKGKVVLGLLAILIVAIATVAVWYFAPKDIESYTVTSAQTPWGWYSWLDGQMQFIGSVQTDDGIYIIHYWKPSVGVWGREDVRAFFNSQMQNVVVHLIAEKKMWMEINISNIGGRIDIYLPDHKILFPEGVR